MIRSLILASVLTAFVTVSCGSAGVSPEQRGASPEPGGVTVADDSAIGRAFAAGRSNVLVEGAGTVSRVLEDDMDGDRHQRFIVQLASGQTLLVAHNIDIAPRIEGLEEGDTVRFKGEYVWNKKGGVIHWTHHDPDGRHVAGWIKRNGKTYQ